MPERPLDMPQDRQSKSDSPGRRRAAIDAAYVAAVPWNAKHLFGKLTHEIACDNRAIAARKPEHIRMSS